MKQSHLIIIIVEVVIVVVAELVEVVEVEVVEVVVVEVVEVVEVAKCSSRTRMSCENYIQPMQQQVKAMTISSWTENDRERNEKKERK